MTAATAEDLRARREAIVKAHIEAESVLHDVDATVATFLHPRYEVPALAATADGPEAVHGLVGALLTAFPDFHLETTAVHNAENAVIVECTFGGTQKGPWAGLSPTGKKMEVQSVLIFQFEGADLICEKVFFDHGTILSQLSAA
jgi:predicted ester cyclase